MNKLNFALLKLPINRWILILLGWTFFASHTYPQPTPEQIKFIQSLNLSTTEKEWLEYNYVVRVHPDTWPPFNYWDMKTGTNQGICVEYLRWISQKTGIHFEYPAMWMPLKHILPALENKQLDLSPSLQKTPEREKYLVYSNSLFKENFGFFGPQNNNKEFSIDANVRISCEDGSRTHKYLAKNYPDIKIIPAFTEEDGLRKVNNGEADYHAGSFSVCTYLINTYYGLDNLHQVYSLKYNSAEIYMAARNDWPELISIINKALSKLPAEKKKAILDNYLNKLDWNKYKDYLLGGLLFLVIVLTITSHLLARSIRRQKEQKKRMRKDELKLQQATKSAGIYFLEFDILKKHFIINSDTALSLTGNSESRIISLKECLNLIYNEDRYIIISAIRDYDKTTDKTLKIRTIHLSGNITFLNCFISYRNISGKNNILISCQDVTLERSYNMQLLSTQRMAHLGHFNIDITTKAFHVSDEIRRIVNLNKAVYFSKELTSILSRPNTILLFKLCRSAINAKHNEYKTTITAEINNHTKHLHITCKLLYNEYGKVILHNGYIQDVTELKKTDILLKEAKNQAEKANKAKSIFLARMSHEIRTPLNVIIGMLNLTFKTQLTDKQHNYIKKTIAASEILLNLINDILDFSKIEANKTTLNYSHFSMHACLDEINNMMAEKALEKKLTLSFNVADNIPQWVYADELRLKQVLINLVSNAIKFTDQGGITIMVTPFTSSNKEVALRFIVKDTGIGIPKGKTDSLFQLFMQLDDSFVRQYEGTGLGLAICKKIVALWDGEIWVKSKQGEGSSFNFTFFAKKGVEPSQLPEEQPEERYMIKTPRILLAEDNLFNQEIAKETLAEINAHVNIVDDGIKALKAAVSGNYDIIFMDIHMPIADGMTATRLIRRKLTKEELPIIAVTAYALLENKKMCLDAGMNDFITKPFVSKDILNALHKHLPDFFSNQDVKQKLTITAHENHSIDNHSALKIIHEAEAKQYFSNNKSKYLHFLNLFHDNYIERFPLIKQLKHKDQLDELKKMAHTIKGEAGYLGLNQLHFICNKVNNEAIIENQIEMLDLLVDTLETTNTSIKTYLALNKWEC